LKTKVKFVNEITGREFDNEKDALMSEASSISIASIFRFWKQPKEAKHSCDFDNWNWCYQRTKEDLDALTTAIIRAVNLHEPWIAEQYKKEGGIKPEHVNALFMLGRYLDDGNSEIRKWLSIHTCICPTCFRQYGQIYYATHCAHDGKIHTRVI